MFPEPKKSEKQPVGKSSLRELMRLTIDANFDDETNRAGLKRKTKEVKSYCDEFESDRDRGICYLIFIIQ